MARSKAFRCGPVAKMKSTRLKIEVDGREYRAAGQARVLVVDAGASGRMGRKIAFVVARILTDQTARNNLLMEVSNTAETSVGTAYDCAWHLTGTESVLQWILDYLTGRIGGADFLCNAHWGMANHDREVMTPVGETSGEMSDIKQLLMTRHKAIVKENLVFCRDGDAINAAEVNAARVAFEATIPDYVEAIKSAPPEVFGPAVIGFTKACKAHGLNPQHYLS